VKIGDFGTSYTKLLDLDAPDATPEIVPTRDLAGDLRVAFATGHNGKRYADRYVNELIALARGGERLIKEKNFVLLDCGSRDIKFISYINGKLDDMGWNAECGSAMGFSIELLERYYNLDFTQLPVPDHTVSVTCGVLGMSDIFDAVISGVEVGEAVTRFVKGIAINAFRFCGNPGKIYLSGGLCDNPVFVNSFPCEVLALGRFVLLEGLKAQLDA
jgi:activator of 2-hydroxyglutaryl-CoA dehydratase